MATATKAVLSIGSGNSTTRRKAVTTSVDSITLPTKITSGVFKNTGANEIRIRINATGGNFWTLLPGEQTPKLLLNGTTIDHQSVGGDSVLECIFEG